MSDHAIVQRGAVLAHPMDVSQLAALDDRFARLYETAFPRVYAFVRAQVGSIEVAQELVGRIFLKVYRHRAKIPQDDTAIVWAFKIAHTTIIDYRRTEGRHAAVSVSIDELVEIVDPLADPEAVYASKETAALVLRAMGNLDHDDRMLLALKFAGQRTNREIAVIVGLSEGAVSMRLLRTLRRLRDRLREMGLA